LDISYTSDVWSLVLNLANLRIIYPGLSKVQTFIQAISTFDQLDTIELSLDRIKEEDINDDQSPFHDKLTTMAIASAEMDVNVFLTFNACIPALKSLTLDRCQIATTSSAVNKAYPVKPPQK